VVENRPSPLLWPSRDKTSLPAKIQNGLDLENYFFHGLADIAVKLEF